MKIAINPGHTLSGLGTGASKILSETGENRKIGKRVIELLKKEGHTVIDCTIDKSSNDLKEAVDKANAAGANMFCSIHLNAGGGNGTETYVYRYGGDAETYAKRVNDKVVASCGFTNRGVKEAGFYVLKNTSMPAILLEVCFVDSADDAKKLNTEKVAVAIVEGILNKSISVPPTNNAGAPYRVRLSWDNAASQKGAFSDLNNAKRCADENPGYSVFDNAGNLIYTSGGINVGSRVKITGTHYATGQVISEWAKSQVHTVSEISGDRALLKEIISWCYLKDLVLA